MKCAGCGAVFCPDQEDQYPGRTTVREYCDRSCRRRYQRKMRRRRRLIEQQKAERRCAEQGKKRYSSITEARRDMCRINTETGMRLKRSYACCDHFHNTTQPKPA